ncbi:NUDIX hydrolase domain-like protein [Lactarius vividus]|nr:NUDIX hydrolase domain-like protein [Lactarius vividus]
MSQLPKILSTEDLDTSDAKWVSLKKINWQDQNGRKFGRPADRRTRGNSGVDELPAGLIDDGETPEQAAIRELREETGYEAEGVLDSSAVMANDPGMSTSNMKLVVLDVPLSGAMESPDQNLEDGEAIVRRAIEVRNLSKELKGMLLNYIVDARLSHFAAGFELAERLRTSDIAP